MAEGSHIDNDCMISFTITPFRSSWLRLFMNGKIIERWVSEIMRPAAEHMLSLCDALMDNTAVAEPFYDEPGGLVWRLTPDKAQPRTMLLEIFELPYGNSFTFREADCDDPIISVVIERRSFLMLLFAELWKNALLCKDPSYQKTRSHFPWKEFRNLIQKWDRSALGPSLAPAP